VAQCTAKSKHTGNRCRAAAIRDRNTCRVHGGMTPVGPASPNYKHGNACKRWPAHMRDAVGEILKDADLIAMRKEIALYDVRIGDLLQKVSPDQEVARWAEIKKTFADFETAQKTKRIDAMEMHLSKLKELIHSGMTDSEIWKDIGDQIEGRRRAVDTEVKRLSTFHEAAVSQQFLVLVDRLVNILDANIADRKTYSTIINAVQGEFFSSAAEEVAGAIPATIP